jgi:mono/diheme cytochrome c family protein
MSLPRAAFAFAAVVLLATVAPALADDVAQVFAKNCSPCHGKDGHPTPVFEKQGVRNFTDPAWQKQTTDAQIEKTIREGKKGTMMAPFEKTLPPQDVKALVGYIRKLGHAKK